MFEPIDHKDSDHGYRQEVRAVVEKLHGTLRSISSQEELVGEWVHSLFSSDGTPYVLHQDGTISCKFDSEESPKGKWEFANDRFTNHTWCEPAPEYGLDEGTWEIVSYHCMATTDGVVVLWNGDGSLQMTLTPRN